MNQTNSECKIIESDSDKLSLLESFDCFLFDCDGVLWEGDDAIAGSIEAVDYLLSKNKQVLFVTNNSSKSRTEYAQKFTKLGFTPVDSANIVTSGSSAAYYVHECLNKGRGATTTTTAGGQKKDVVFFIGMPALKEELDRVGLQSICASDLDLPQTIKDWQTFQKNPKVGAVVVGADWFFTYAKGTAAACYLVHDDVIFVGTNEDARLPTANPEIINCGTGSIIKMVEVGSGRNAVYVGKPEAIMWEHVANEFKDGFDLKRTLMVGDTLATDILFANNGGIASLLVETGSNSRKDVEDIKERYLQSLSTGQQQQQNSSRNLMPTYIAKCLKDALL